MPDIRGTLTFADWLATGAAITGAAIKVRPRGRLSDMTASDGNGAKRAQASRKRLPPDRPGSARRCSNAAEQPDHRVLAVSAHRGLRLPVGLRGHRPGGAQRRDRWMCLPRMDSPSVFGAILDRDAGRFLFGPEDVAVPADRRYLPGTMVVETSWDCGEGWIIVRDCLLMGPWRHEHPETSSHTRPPTDYDAEHILLRTVRCVNGNVQLVMDCEPVFDYGRQRENWRRTDREYYQAAVNAGDLALTLTSDIRIGIEGPSARSRTLLHEGDTRFCALSWGSMAAAAQLRGGLPPQVWTAHHWQHWLARGNFPDHRWRGYLARSALTLKGLTFAPTGAIAAAATTSLPETPGGERNWDYRYSWIRDATFALWGLYTLGFDWEANDFFSFLAEVAERDRGDLQIVYGVDGRCDLSEHTLKHLHGYQGARARIAVTLHQQPILIHQRQRSTTPRFRRTRIPITANVITRRPQPLHQRDQTHDRRIFAVLGVLDFLDRPTQPLPVPRIEHQQHTIHLDRRHRMSISFTSVKHHHIHRPPRPHLNSLVSSMPLHFVVVPHQIPLHRPHRRLSNHRRITTAQRLQHRTKTSTQRPPISHTTRVGNHGGNGRPSPPDD